MQTLFQCNKTAKNPKSIERVQWCSKVTEFGHIFEERDCRKSKETTKSRWKMVYWSPRLHQPIDKTKGKPKALGLDRSHE